MSYGEISYLAWKAAPGSRLPMYDKHVQGKEWLLRKTIREKKKIKLKQSWLKQRKNQVLREFSFFPWLHSKKLLACRDCWYNDILNRVYFFAAIRFIIFFTYFAQGFRPLVFAYCLGNINQSNNYCTRSLLASAPARSLQRGKPRHDCAWAVLGRGKCIWPHFWKVKDHAPLTSTQLHGEPLTHDKKVQFITNKSLRVNNKHRKNMFAKFANPLMIPNLLITRFANRVWLTIQRLAGALGGEKNSSLKKLSLGGKLHFWYFRSLTNLQKLCK